MLQRSRNPPNQKNLHRHFCTSSSLKNWNWVGVHYFINLTRQHFLQLYHWQLSLRLRNTGLFFSLTSRDVDAFSTFIGHLPSNDATKNTFRDRCLISWTKFTFILYLPVVFIKTESEVLVISWGLLWEVIADPWLWVMNLTLFCISQVSTVTLRIQTQILVGLYFLIAQEIKFESAILQVSQWTGQKK